MTVAVGRRCGDPQKYRHDGCHCPECREGHRRYMADRRRQRAYGRGDELVDATVTLALVRWLLGEGWRKRDVAAAVGLSKAGMSRLGRGGMVRRSTAGRVRDVADQVRGEWT